MFVISSARSEGQALGNASSDASLTRHSGADATKPDLVSQLHKQEGRHSPSELDLSIVVPAMNEEQTVDKLVNQIADVCASIQKTHEVILIDDGSTDATWQKMQELARTRKEVTAIRMRRNFGKAAALSAGFDAASGAIVFTMDADLQDDPAEIPRFLEKLDSGLDVISGWKKVRHDPWHKVLPSRVFNGLVSTLTGVKLHDHNCGFKAYRRAVLSEVDLYGERHRFVPVLADSRGFRVGEIIVQHHARQFGQSKYGVSRIAKGFLDLMSIYLVTGYGRRPLHLIGAAGLICFATGAAGMLYLTAAKVVAILTAADPIHLHKTAVFYYCITAILLGAQCFLAGLLAELIVSLVSNHRRPSDSFYSISEKVCGEGD
ncbi:MAG: glycosyltransferase family 2 protein [Planctomycetota bacterium]